MASSPAPSISRSQAVMLALASAIACSLRPTWSTEEPQQPEPATFTTSMSWRVSSRTVASLTSGASTCWPQPGISAMRLRRSPAAGNTCGRSTGEGAGTLSGTASSMARRRRRKVAPPGSLLVAGSSGANGLARRPSTMAQRKAAGRGINQASSPRMKRSVGDLV